MSLWPVAVLLGEPSALPAALTVSGNEITDATRAANVQGDGRTADSSFGIWEATTNLIPNGGAETDAAGWSNGGVARSTAKHKFGAASFKFTTAGGANDATSVGFTGATGGSTITCSCWINPDVTVSMNLQLNEYDAASGFSGFSQGPAVTCPAGVWTRLVHTVTLAALTTQGVLYITTADVQPICDVYIDGAQIEQHPVATPYVETNGTAATRNAARVQAPATLLDETQGWVALRVRMGFATSGTPPAPYVYLLEWVDDPILWENYVGVWYNTGFERFECGTGSSAGAPYPTVLGPTEIFAAGGVKTVVFAWWASGVKLSIDGAPFIINGLAPGGPITGLSPLFDIASSGGPDPALNGDVFWFACGAGTLSDADAAALHGYGNTPPAIGSFPGNATMLWNADTPTVEQPLETYPLDEVRADVQIHHGRTEAFAEPAASTCQVSFLEVDHAFVEAFRVGAPLAVTVANGGPPVPRFTGRVTDATLDVDTLTVIATGKLSELGQYAVGLSAWPIEPWVDRVERVFAEAGLSGLLVLDAPGRVFDPLLAARDPLLGPLTLADSVNALAAMAGAAVIDLPDGRILVQPLGERDFSTSVELDPADIAYAPVWTQLLPAGNVVTVTYTPGTTLPLRTGVLTDESPIVTGLSSTLDILPGMAVTGIGIPEDTRVQSVDTASQIRLTRSANLVANKDGAILPGETRIREVSETSDLSVGMTVEKAGDIQAGSKVVELHRNEVDISLPAVGTHQGNFLYTAPSSATLTFFAETAYVTLRDETSIALYGERPLTIDTTFLTVEDANQRATDRLARAALPRWNLPAAPIVRGLLLQLGSPVTVTDMPAASPAVEWLAIVEGWSEQITGDDWTMELNLSDPAASGYVFGWAYIPIDVAWNELDPGASWVDATTLGGIIP